MAKPERRERRLIDAAQALLLAAGAIYALLGTAHAALTVRDLVHARTFTPTDDDVRLAMRATGVAFSAHKPWAQPLWRTWLGLNLTHSVGLLLFCGLLLVAAFAGDAAFAGSSIAALATVIVATLYLLLARYFFFIGPALAAAVALACAVVAWVIA